ncbi:tRNA1(Val) (adenine(37)-N6)-methyltransferase [Staphylococcus sp. SQ8-PEA]|uniref:tRNA1(Val) (Adenine(37)-N6)-methyltransferase n=1 Tax=Staphylococcus marylandisciuri TaxID=2981529 RepID=A0ABT2QST4_9STAP|nr:tRNA1(Val) (adenine(37)-N6)-methyltransferase [Staphylococcus marylandisciuri]MCU5747056.1 tRNA1(Val) (adenine(37)-N6)-methyltransferase [Staphylococcus marylandisciuri]
MLAEQERLDYLIKEQLRIIQNDEVFSFSTDAVLLGHFTKIKNKDRIIDLCAGNGIIQLLLSAKSSQLIEGIEIQERLVNMAERSFLYNHLEDRLKMHHLDLKNVYQAFQPAQYDVVTCNPPYFKTDQRHQHLKEAHKIARHEIKCNLSDVCKAARHLLKQGGRLVMVHRADRLMDVLTTMREYCLEPKQLRFIYSKPGKKAQMIIVEGRQGGRGSLAIESPFYIYDNEGKYTEEMREVYYG